MPSTNINNSTIRGVIFFLSVSIFWLVSEQDYTPLNSGSLNGSQPRMNPIIVWSGYFDIFMRFSCVALGGKKM